MYLNLFLHNTLYQIANSRRARPGLWLSEIWLGDSFIHRYTLKKKLLLGNNPQGPSAAPAQLSLSQKTKTKKNTRFLPAETLHSLQWPK